MADYIDRGKTLDAVLQLPPKMDEKGYGWLGRMGVWQMLSDFPSADVAPVKHGRWIFNKPPDDWIMSLYTCDQCSHVEDGKPNYCPNCGADMREES